jgi:hypothetical protein
MMERAGSLSVRRTPPALWLIPFILPVVGYVALATGYARARRRREDIGWARSQAAHRSGMRRLQDVAKSGEPAEALYRALVAFIADAFNFDGAGKTSADINAELTAAGVPADIRDRTVQILRACERERYASQRHSNDEILALLGAAESCMSAIDAHALGGRWR